MTDPDYQNFPEGQIKHLEMAQTVVARLGNNGFVVKGWAVTVGGAFLGFGITRENGWLALAGILPTCFFWFLDASFLRSERAFRMLFGRIRQGEIEPFFMNATAPGFLASLAQRERGAIAWRATLRRPSLALFYGALVVAALTVAIILGISERGSEGESRPPVSTDRTADATHDLCRNRHRGL